MIYLDHNASSPLLPAAQTAWLEAEERFPGNPSSQHRIGARAEHALELAGQNLACLLECSPLDIVWTSGATEACVSVLHHASVHAPTGRVCVSAIEHPAVLASAQHYFPGRVELLPVDRRGVADLNHLADLLSRHRPALVALMAANNETGVLQPWQEAHALCRQQNVAFFTDATQWCGRLPTQGLGTCDFVSGSAHKFGGPRGCGFLAGPGVRRLVPLLRGGGQQQERRAGTGNVASPLALVAALTWCEQQLVAGRHDGLRQARDRFELDLAATLPETRINGAGAPRLWNTLSVTLPAVDCRPRWVVKLDKAGFAVSTGSACASGTEKPSHVLDAMGLGADEASRALRFSAGWLTPPSVWSDLRQAILRLAYELSSASPTSPGVSNHPPTAA